MVWRDVEEEFNDGGDVVLGGCGEGVGPDGVLELLGGEVLGQPIGEGGWGVGLVRGEDVDVEVLVSEGLAVGGEDLEEEGAGLGWGAGEETCIVVDGEPGSVSFYGHELPEGGLRGSSELELEGLVDVSLDGGWKIELDGGVGGVDLDGDGEAVGGAAGGGGCAAVVDDGGAGGGDGRGLEGIGVGVRDGLPSVGIFLGGQLGGLPRIG